MTTTRDYLDTLPALPDTVLAVLAREVTATDYHRAAQGGGYDVATLVEVAGRIVARELHAAPPGEVDRLRAIEQRARTIADADLAWRDHGEWITCAREILGDPPHRGKVDR